MVVKVKELHELKEVYGERFTKKDDIFTREVLSDVLGDVLDMTKLSRRLTSYEALEGLYWLVNSCKRSTERVRDKSNKTYYGLRHDWLVDCHGMASYHVQNKAFVYLWFEDLIQYIDSGREYRMRPTLERVDPQLGYIKNNIVSLPFKDNTANAAGCACIGFACLEGVLTLFESKSVEAMVQLVNDRYGLELEKRNYKGKATKQLRYETYDNDFAMTIVAKNTLRSRTEIIDVKFDVLRIDTGSLNVSKLPALKEVENMFKVRIHNDGLLKIEILRTDTY
ncbi:hypothetical protein [Paenibacillus sp. FSL K6-2524]|uniref:hypothetical protein n=1 Tax=Paenibacillus sp. FSL K6-2524 TaxID=2954516 RepID=UPI0030FB082D